MNIFYCRVAFFFFHRIEYDREFETFVLLKFKRWLCVMFAFAHADAYTNAHTVYSTLRKIDFAALVISGGYVGLSSFDIDCSRAAALFPFVPFRFVHFYFIFIAASTTFSRTSLN